MINRVRPRGRTAAVTTVATVSTAALLFGAAGATAGSAGRAAVPATAAAEVSTVDTCSYPTQKLKVGVRLTLRDAGDNDIKRIKVRAANKKETGSFYRKGITLRSIKITTHQVDGDAISVGVYTRTASPAYVNLNVNTSGAEIDKVVTVSRFRLANGATASATCSVSLTSGS